MRLGWDVGVGRSTSGIRSRFDEPKSGGVDLRRRHDPVDAQPVENRKNSILVQQRCDRQAAGVASPGDTVSHRSLDGSISCYHPATLFLTGLWMEAYPVITRDLSNDPLFELGNHSYSHGAFRTPCYGLAHTPQPNQTAEVRQTDELLKKYAVSYKKYFRFPGLCFDMEVARSVEAEGYIVVGGDVYSGDGFETKPAKIVYNVMAHVHPGSIIIFHLQGGRNAPETANALVAIVQKLRSQGYAFVKVSELLKLRGSG